VAVPPLDTDHARLTSPYGLRKLNGRDDWHSGIDLAAAIGEPVYAVTGGTVIVSDPPGVLAGYGNVVIIAHPSSVSRTIYSLYGHMDARTVVRGAKVVEGQVIGAVGNTGGARGETDKHIAGPHLHFELLTKWPSKPDENRIDPTRLWPPALQPRAQQQPAPRPSPAGQPAARSSTSDLVLLGVAAYAAHEWFKGKSRRGS
jgi:murein DD-endopeptidase MepM/ murein hydrolase activator NlpD